MDIVYRRKFLPAYICKSGVQIRKKACVRSKYCRTAKRYTKKPRQALVSSSLDSLGLSAAVAHGFLLQKTSLMDSWGGGWGVCCIFQGVCKSQLVRY